MGTVGEDRRVDGSGDDPGVIDSPASVHANGGGPILQHIEIGASKSVLIVLLFCAFASAAAVIGLMWAVLAFQQNSAHVNVLQYDLAQMKAQLEEQGLYERTGH